MDPVDDVVNWTSSGLETKLLAESIYGSPSRQIRNEALYAHPGVAFTMIGSEFSARLHRWRCIIDGTATSVFSPDRDRYLCLLNSAEVKSIMAAFNPTIHFEIGDVVRVPLFEFDDARVVTRMVRSAFTLHESHREPSVEFRGPGPSPWRHAQDWAQAAVDRPDGAPLPDYVEVLDPEPPTDHLSFALSVALGRFGPAGSPQEGILDPAPVSEGGADLSHTLPAGILFLDTTLQPGDRRDSLGHPAAAPLHDAWATHGRAIETKRKTLRDYLALDFFGGVHKGMYDNRPIHWPLSSAGRTFVAWVNIHRFTGQTLRVLLADHLVPTQARLQGELNDLRAARDGADEKAARQAEKQYARVLKAKDELSDFIAAVEACADQGPPPTGPKCPPRAQDARYTPDLDDGVMINSAALWPLLEPQWKDPKKWWTELATAKGRKDYDWSHLAMRHWPDRVDAKCKADPSLGVAHGCFWRYHPERAWAWELRLQDEIGPAPAEGGEWTGRIEEPPYRPGGRDLGDGGDAPHRAAFLRDHPDAALAAVEKEAVRRMGRGKDKKLVPELRILEAGLWADHAEDLWALELKLSEKQGLELRILAPDEPEGRAAFEAENPDRVRGRALLIADLVPPPELFAALEPER